ncbi:carbohydrate-binding protein [Tamlana sp. 2_MG-2023]|uniref:T9SS type A sorting domain-containing protein n=1 Tax=unclassified Tamlana TaxID=2614803 RepID=UPI0026E34C04|nr:MULTISPECIES: T9SS type A sorting domain-containing protein [unclassified Tamlana]MDO6761312.1 carbohydrate-binding protein [Tamlana sp. 2_MG-2023]MDO6791795.1 carbohydrate-binding protein [Tamlana sp. 1_MG-2023]
MTKFNKLTKLLFLFVLSTQAQDWSGIPVPADAGSGNIWELQDNVSDDFNYNFNSTSWSNFGTNNKWYNFYHNAWDGPGYTYWKNENVTVDGSDLVINVGYTSENGKGGSYGVASGCVTSTNKVKYPVYVESAISVANISLASCFWLLSPDDTEEIDIIENYGGVNGFKHLTHISHHSFVRSPFTDYQPRDWNSWFPDSRVSQSYGWGDWCYNNGGDRRYMRMGVNWISPKHFEYYIDGELVRVMYYNAIATKFNGTWEYTYFNSMNWDVNGYKLPTNNGSGYTDVTVHATSSVYNFNTLQAASNASNGYNVIDPAWFQGGDDNDDDGNGVTVEARGFTKEMDIIINMESQSWLTGSTPSNADLNNPAKNQMKVDWVRVYKPVNDPASGGSNSHSLIIEAEDFHTTGGTFDDGVVPFGVNKATTTINHVNKEDYAEYKLDVTAAETGVYEINYQISTPADNAGVSIYLNGVLISDDSVPNNGDWDNYQELTAGSTITLPTGTHDIKIVASGTNDWQWNMDKIEFGFLNALSVSNAEINQVKLFPNPANNIINIHTESALTGIEIYNILGAKALEQKNNIKTVSTENLKSGSYFMKVMTEKGSTTKHIIVKH